MTRPRPLQRMIHLVRSRWPRTARAQHRNGIAARASGCPEEPRVDNGHPIPAKAAAVSGAAATGTAGPAAKSGDGAALDRATPGSRRGTPEVGTGAAQLA